MYPSRGAQLLAEALEAHGLTQTTASKMLGVGQSTLSHWMSGRRTPDREGAALLLARLNIPIESWGEWPLCSSGKKVFDKRGAEGARNRRQRGGSGGLRVYTCPTCGWWHLTRSGAQGRRR